MKHRKEHLPLVNFCLLKPILTSLEKSQIDWRKMLSELGLRRDLCLNSSGLYVPVIPAVDLLLEQSAHVTNDPSFGAKTAYYDNVEDWPIFAQAFRGSLSVSDFFVSLSRSLFRMCPSSSLKVNVTEDHAECQIERRYQARFKTKQKDAYVVIKFLRALQMMTESSFSDSQVKISISDPNAIPEDYFKGQRAYSPDNLINISFPSSWMLCSIKGDPIGSTGSAEHSVPIGILGSLRHVLENCADMNKLDSDSIASFCDCSLQSLQLELRKLGNSLSEEIMRARMNRAMECLSEGMSVTRAAELAGYRNSTSFSRAFKGWFGVAPKDSINHHAKLQRNTK